jgi:hypothetical protein
MLMPNIPRSEHIDSSAARDLVARDQCLLAFIGERLMRNSESDVLAGLFHFACDRLHEAEMAQERPLPPCGKGGER